MVVDFIAFAMNPEYYHVFDLFGWEILFTIYIYIYIDYLIAIFIYIFFLNHRGKGSVAQEIGGGFAFVPGLFSIVLRRGYLYGAWTRTVLILIEFKLIVPELRQLVVFCTCRILPEGLKFVENSSLRLSFFNFITSTSRARCFFVW